MKSVHEDVQYNCDKCVKSFSQKSRLNSHIKSTHENVRYNCDKCEKSFTTKRHLKTHIQSVHEKVRYNCDHCDKSFSHRESLIRHNKSAHDNVRHNCEKWEYAILMWQQLYFWKRIERTSRLTSNHQNTSVHSVSPYKSWKTPIDWPKSNNSVSKSTWWSLGTNL